MQAYGISRAGILTGRITFLSRSEKLKTVKVNDGQADKTMNK